MENSIKNNVCSNCGSLLSVNSLVCAACGFTLHQSSDSEKSFDKMILNIENNLFELKSSYRITAMDSLKSHIFIILPLLTAFLIALPFLFKYDKEVINIGIVLVLILIILSFIADRYKIKFKKINTVQLKNKIDNSFSEINKLYGEDISVKRLLIQYTNELVLWNKIKRRDFLNVIFGYIAFTVFLFTLYFIIPQESTWFEEKQTSAADIDKILLPSQTTSFEINPLRTEINGNLSEYIELSEQTCKTVHTITPGNLQVDIKDVKFKIKKTFPADFDVNQYKWELFLTVLDSEEMCSYKNASFQNCDIGYGNENKIKVAMQNNKTEFSLNFSFRLTDIATENQAKDFITGLPDMKNNAKYFIVTGIYFK